MRSFGARVRCDPQEFVARVHRLGVRHVVVTTKAGIPLVEAFERAGWRTRYARVKSVREENGRYVVTRATEEDLDEEYVIAAKRADDTGEDANTSLAPSFLGS